MQTPRHFLRQAARSLRTPIVALTLLLSAVAALAAPITKTFSFTASGFPAGSPVATVQGSFTVTWDPTVPVTNQSTGLTQHSLNLPYDGTLVFTSAQDTLVIGAGVDGAGFVHANTDDFFVFISGATTATPTFTVVYAQVGLPGIAPVSTAFRAVLPPTVRGVNPASGVPAGGTSVTITGTDFTGATAVTFGGTPAAFTVDSATQITAITPAHALGAADVVVSTFAGDGTGTALFAYVNPIVVTTTSDTPAAGQLTLREAIALANSQAGPDAITFDPTVFAGHQTIVLNAVELPISTALAITGPAAGVTISGNHRSRVFMVNLPDNNTTASLSGVTVTGGEGSGSVLNGSGGGIFLYRGNLNLTGCTIDQNTATTEIFDGSGGGIYAPYGSGTLTITNCSITGNTSNRSGGGIASTSTLVMTGCTVADNTSNGQIRGVAGGVEGNGLTTLTNCTIVGNRVLGNQNGSAGGVFVQAGPENGSGGISRIIHCTITDNAAAGNLSAGGVRLDHDNLGTVVLVNTIVAGNTGAEGATADLNDTASGTGFTSGGYNFIGDASGATGFTQNVNGDQAGTAAHPLDPRLGVLGNHGGPTQTIPLLWDSPAIDRAKAVGGLATDQRGELRTVDLPESPFPNAVGGDGTDIGAYEAQTEPLAPEIAISYNGVEITAGETTPAAADGTDYGPAEVGGFQVGHSFTITNMGALDLHLTGSPAVALSGPGAGQFSVFRQPPSPLAPNGSKVVLILFHPTATGPHTATVTVTSDDADEGTFTFDITGAGVRPPRVSAATSAGVTATTATLGGNVTDDGNAPVTERGVIFAPTATNRDPRLGQSNVTKVTVAGTTGVFTVPVTGLLPNTRYSYNAYATNSVGTGYTGAATFTTNVLGTADAVAATRPATRIYPLANDVTLSGRPLQLLGVSNPAILIDGRALIIPAGFTGSFTYTFTDGLVSGEATVNVTAGAVVANARTFSGLLLDPHGAIAGAVDATFTATGRAATVRMTAGTHVARFSINFPAGSTTGGTFVGFGELTLTRNLDGTVSASFASAGDLLGGLLKPRKAATIAGRYNAALASIDAAIPGGGYLFLNTLSSSAALMIGRLPDGQVFSASTSVRDDGTVAFHAIVRRGVNPVELVAGELVFADLTATDLTGEVAWAKPVQRPRTPGLHLGGVNTVLTVNGCEFKGQPLPTSAGVLSLTGGNLHLPEVTSIQLHGGRPSVPTRSLYRWTAYPKLGIFSARVDIPDVHILAYGAGVYLPKSHSAWGFFPGTTVGGRIELTTR
jgi:hypothetical protein